MAKYRSKYELLDLIYDLKEDLDKRTKEIKGLGYSTPFSATEQYDKLRKDLDKTELGQKDIIELTNLYRDLKYINDLSTSSVKGAERAYNEWTPVQEQLSYLSKDKQDQFWKIYEKLIENVGYQPQYKYDDFQTIMEYLYEGEDTFDILKNMEEIYNREGRVVGGREDTGKRIQSTF